MQICEIKYSSTSYGIDKAEAQNLARKVRVYQTKTEKQIFLSYITASRLKHTLYAEEMVTSSTTLEDLFVSV